MRVIEPDLLVDHNQRHDDARLRGIILVESTQESTLGVRLVGNKPRLIGGGHAEQEAPARSSPRLRMTELAKKVEIAAARRGRVLKVVQGGT